MRLIHLPTSLTVLIDIVIWFIIHMGVVLIMVRIPRRFFNPQNSIYQTGKWENDGSIYQKILKIKKWKKYAPDGANILKEKGFPKRKLMERGNSYIHSFVLETCRAEMTHWIIIFSAPFFFLWNRFGVGVIMIIYVIAENLPLIMVQRYNRARFLRLLSKRGYKAI